MAFLFAKKKTPQGKAHLEGWIAAFTWPIAPTMTECTILGAQLWWLESTAAPHAAAGKSLLDETAALRLDDHGNLPGALKVTALSRPSTASC